MRAGILGLVLAAATALPTAVAAQTLNAEEARRFIAGKTFSFNCFEGTRGAGRIMHDGSVAGSIQLAGAGPTRYVQLPPNTLRIKGAAVCASLKGMFFEPCFNVEKTDAQSFRGSVSGMGFAYCEFTRRDTGKGRVRMARSLNRPRALVPPASTGTVGAAKTENVSLELRSSKD